MLDIEFKGGNTVVLSTKKATLVSDPRMSLVGKKDITLKDSIQLATEPRMQVVNDQARLLIEGPGEYEVADFSIRGVPAQRHLDTSADEQIATIYRIEVGDLRIALLGNIDDKLTEEQLEGLGVVDILILPVGGAGYTLDATSAANLVRRIDPKVVIPVHYDISGLTYEVPQDTITTFESELGAPVEKVAKYKLKSAASLPQVLTVVEVEYTA